jgi:hypothetical protein
VMRSASAMHSRACRRQYSARVPIVWERERNHTVAPLSRISEIAPVVSP